MNDNNFVFHPGAVIESDTAILRREARALHEKWLANPGSAELKHSFAAALRRWGKAAHKQDAVEHADKLARDEI